MKYKANQEKKMEEERNSFLISSKSVAQVPNFEVVT
jgi:hypothetical protein